MVRALTLLWAALAWAAGQAWAAPAPQAASGQTFKAIYGAAPRSLDPQGPVDRAAWPVIMAAYERLMTFEAGTAKPVPGLARRVIVSPNGLNYTFVLEEGHTFSDGTVVGSEAALFTFDRLMSGETGRQYFPHLSRLEIIGPYTFRLILKRPWPPFLASLALPQASLVSPGLRNKPADYLDGHTLGSGQYVLSEWRDQPEPQGVTLVLASRPDLTTQPPIATAMFHYEADPARRYEKMARYGAHLTVDPALPAGGALPGGLQTREVMRFAARFLAFNCSRPYTKMQNTRRALGFLARDAFKDRPGRLAGPFPQGLFYNAPRTAPNDPPAADPAAQGAMILKEVGPPAGPLSLAYAADDAALAPDAKLIAQTLAPYGVDVELVALEGALGRRIVESGDYDMYLGTREADIPSADMWLGRFMDGNSSPEGNPALFRHQRAGELVREIADLVGKDEDGPEDLKRVEMDRAAKIGQLAEINDLEGPYAFLCQPRTVLALDPMVKLWRGSQVVDGITHPMWPEVWPIEQTVLRPAGGAAPGAAMPSIQSILKKGKK